MDGMTPGIDAADAVSQPHEIIKANLSKNEHPTEGEWKRALADRKVMEQAFTEHTPDPDSDTVSIAHKLRGERFVAVPEGAHTVGFVWKVVPQTTTEAIADAVAGTLAH